MTKAFALVIFLLGDRADMGGRKRSFLPNNRPLGDCHTPRPDREKDHSKLEWSFSLPGKKAFVENCEAILPNFQPQAECSLLLRPNQIWLVRIIMNLEYFMGQEAL